MSNDEYDLLSENFDAAKALEQSHRVVLPCPDAPIMNNISEFENRFMKERKSQVEGKDLNQKELDGKGTKENENEKEKEKEKEKKNRREDNKNCNILQEIASKIHESIKILK